jgi:hypothetical protein
MIGRSGDAAICTVHVVTRNVDFLVEPRNQGRRFVSGLTSKPLGQFISGLTSKPLGRFISGLTSKLPGRFISGLALKPVATISPYLASKPVVGFLVHPQN